jgi:hypothetical protein
MDLLVDRPQLVKVVKSYLTKSFGDLTSKTSKEYVNSVFYVNSDDVALIEYCKLTDHLFISYQDIWSKLESYFPIKGNDIGLIILDWLVEHYKLDNLKLSETTAGTGFSLWNINYL